MNKRYLSFKDGVIVIDENANVTESANQEGLERVLEQENLVEEIQKQINRVQNELRKYAGIMTSKKKFWKSFITYSFLILPMLVIVGLCFDSGMSLISPFRFALGMGVICELFCTLFALTDYEICKTRNKERHALEAQLQYLKEREKVEVAKLEQMKQSLAKQGVVGAKKEINREINLDNLRQLRDELTSVYKDNNKLPKQGKQKVLG